MTESDTQGATTSATTEGDTHGGITVEAHATGPLGAPEPKHVPDIGEVLAGVFAVLEGRKRDMPEGSYTTKLLMGPQDKLLKKIGEEASEVIIAARDQDLTELRYEVGDLVYHLLVLLVREGLTLDDLAAELDSRRR